MKGTIKNKTVISEIFSSGNKVKTNTITSLYLKSTISEVLISSPISKFKDANKRNRVKRLIRECLKDISLPNASIVFIYNLKTIEDIRVIKKDTEFIIKTINDEMGKNEDTKLDKITL